jgi:hypothetical protein
MATQILVMKVRQSAEQFIAGHDRCPLDLRELVEVRNIDERDRTDPWGQNVLLVCAVASDGPIPVVLSAGPDRKFGTFDDVSSASLQ